MEKDRKRKWDDKGSGSIDKDKHTIVVDISSNNSHLSFLKSSLFPSLLRNKLQLSTEDPFNITCGTSKISITADNEDIVKAAEVEILNVIRTGQFKRNLVAKTTTVDIPLGFDYPTSQTSFLRGKLLGPQGSFLKHIQSSTQTKVQLRGKGSGFFEVKIKEGQDCDLYLRVDGAEADKIEEARQLCQDLIATVKVDFDIKMNANATQYTPQTPQTPLDYAQQQAMYQQYWAAYQQAYAAQYYQIQQYQQYQDQTKKK